MLRCIYSLLRHFSARTGRKEMKNEDQLHQKLREALKHFDCQRMDLVPFQSMLELVRAP